MTDLPQIRKKIRRGWGGAEKDPQITWASSLSQSLWTAISLAREIKPFL